MPLFSPGTVLFFSSIQMQIGIVVTSIKEVVVVVVNISGIALQGWLAISCYILNSIFVAYYSVLILSSVKFYIIKDLWLRINPEAHLLAALFSS